MSDLALAPVERREASSALLMAVAVAAGALVANIYYAQPLIASIGPDLGVSPEFAGAIVSVTQIGYGLGLLLIVPLADLIENRRLALVATAVAVVSLVGAAVSPSASSFFLFSLFVGVSSTGAQVLLPYVAQFIEPERRGRVIGNVMGGLLAGVMLSRPLALFIAAEFGWLAVFWVSAALIVAIEIALARLMLVYRPRGATSYGKVLASMLHVLRDAPAIRWRAAYQALLFCAFNLFWTAVPLMLAERFGMDARAIALFALAGAGGALAAPIAGRLADRGLGQLATGCAVVAAGASLAATTWAAATTSLAAMVGLAVVIDAATQATHIVNQRTILSVEAAIRGRANALYMTFTFVGGAIGSLLGPYAIHAGGWSAAALTGAAVCALALAVVVAEGARAR